jgi:hypothetical protein
MGVQDFVKFDVDDYRWKVRGWDDKTLQRKEVVLIRTSYSSTAGVISGVVMAPGTGGASLIGSVAGGRAMVLVEQKLEVVRAELSRRGLPLHVTKTRDQAIPTVTGGMAGAMGLVSGMEGHLVGTAAAAGANLVGVETKKLDRVHTAPDRPSISSGNSFQKLRRTLTDAGRSKARALQNPFSSEDKALFQENDNLLRRSQTLEERYQKLRETTLGAAGDKWYTYVVHHHPCQAKYLTITNPADSCIKRLRTRDSLGRWDQGIHQDHRESARTRLNGFRREVEALEERMDEWQALVTRVCVVVARAFQRCCCSLTSRSVSLLVQYSRQTPMSSRR